MTMIFLLSACLQENRTNNSQGTSGEASQADPVVSSMQCFRNEFPYEATEDPDDQDMEELIVMIDGDSASGEYNWIPAYKDQRLGISSGSFQENLIKATYEYQQEGQSATTEIVISIEAEHVTVEGGSSELGLNRTLARVEC